MMPPYVGTGAAQMAIDSWLLDQHVKGFQPPSLRFYTWLKPTLSLGYHQRQYPAHWNHLHWQGQPIELVRRPTGGRAVLHQGDLTYAIVIPQPKGFSRQEVYQQICQFLIEGWRSLGVTLTFGSAKRGYIHNPDCFGSATAADLLMEDGYKLIGSAQVYRGGAVLQHGSMRLQPDEQLFTQVFGETSLDKTALSPNLPKSLQTASGIKTIAQALTQAASDCFNVCFELQPLTSAEVQSALNAFAQKLEPLSS
jgi:lipoate---protein ligase